MNTLSAIALVMLVMVGYSAGVTAVARYKHPHPTLVDLGQIGLLWALAFVARPIVGHGWSLPLWTATAFFVAWLSANRRYRYFSPNRAAVPLTRQHPRLWGRLWQRWSAFAAEMGEFQSRLLMGFFYFFLVTPFGLGARLFSDMLGLKRPSAPSAWHARPPVAATLEEVKRQG
ncbi:MAG: hypothetical protein R6X32_00435 [Chloroflexota bacterium]